MSTVENDWLSAFCSYHIGTEGIEGSSKPFKFMLAGNGIVKQVENEVGVFTVKFSDATVPGMTEVEEAVSLKLPKIPYQHFDQTIAFFKKIMVERNGAEAMVQFYFDRETQNYILYCPEQTVSSARVSFTRNAEMDEKYLLVMDIHSHNSMSAFFSGVDDNDEKETRLFGVVGKLNREVFEVSFRAGVSGKFIPMDLTDIFECPTSATPDDTFPEEWMSRCVKATSSAYPITKYTGGYRDYRSGADKHRGLQRDYFAGWGDTGYGGMFGDLYDEIYYYPTSGLPATRDRDDDYKPLAGNKYDVDVLTMTRGSRMDILYDMLLYFAEDVAFAIFHEEKQEEIATMLKAYKDMKKKGDL